MPDATCLLAATPDAPQHARRFVHDMLAGPSGTQARAADAELLVSEMVTGALREHPAYLSVTLALDADHMRCEVAVAADDDIHPDASEVLQRKISRRFVDELADDWASDLDRTRTSMWFELSFAS